MTVDLHSAVRTAVDEARRLAREASGDPWVTGTSMGYEYSRPGDVYAIAADGTPARIAVGTQCGPDISAEQSSGPIAYWNPSRALAMCDWADDVLARHRRLDPIRSTWACAACQRPGICDELISVAAAFGVETGETP